MMRCICWQVDRIVSRNIILKGLHLLPRCGNSWQCIKQYQTLISKQSASQTSLIFNYICGLCTSNFRKLIIELYVKSIIHTYIIIFDVVKTFNNFLKILLLWILFVIRVCQTKRTVTKFFNLPFCHVRCLDLSVKKTFCLLFLKITEEWVDSGNVYLTLLISYSGRGWEWCKTQSV